MSSNSRVLTFAELSEAEKTDIYAIYLSCIDSSLGDQWSEKGLLDILSLEGAFSLFLKGDDGGLLGFIILRCVVDEAELLNVGVRPQYRQNGYGSRLLKAMVDVLKNTAIKSVFLEVRETNIAAQKLYIANGFRLVGRRGDYYDLGDKGREDALIMSKTFVAD